MPRPHLKIDLVAHGRFYAFDLGAALIDAGHDVRVLTNYPASIAVRWGLPKSCLKTLPAHGIAARIAVRLRSERTDPVIHRSFGRWAAANIRPDADIVHVMSGVAEETLSLPRSRLPHAVRQVGRGSAHIATQDELLKSEAERIGGPVERPSAWMIGREKREYALADQIVVLSTFARRTFLEHGFAPEQLVLCPLGVDTRRFVAGPEVIERRVARILSGKVLHVITVGTLSARKGALDHIEIARALRGLVSFSAVASISPEINEVLRGNDGLIRIEPRVDEQQLPAKYAAADLFIFPTVEDGFGAVLAQAQAAGLPVLATENCGGPDLVIEGETGWTLPIRSPQAFVERIKWCNDHRSALAAIVRNCANARVSRSWHDMAAKLLEGAEPRLTAARRSRMA